MPGDNETLLLYGKRKKGPLRVIFSRFGIAALLIIAQIALSYYIYTRIGLYFKLLTAVQTVFGIVMFLYLCACDMDYSGKLTWLFLMTAAPLPGAFLLLYTRRDIAHRLTKRRLSELTEESRGVIAQDPEVLADETLVSSGTDDLCTFVCRSGSFPVFAHTRTRYFPEGEAFYDALIEKLRGAEHFIFLEYFIIDEGYMWGSILKILADKAAAGVDVRVMYDGLCEASRLPENYPARLEKLGIRCKSFLPLTPFVSTQYNYRDHRKIAVIDGRSAFTGGINLADEYINRISPFGRWKDTALLVEGEAVQSFTLMFLQMWNLSEKEPKWDEARVCFPAESDGFVMPYSGSPLDGIRVSESVYIDMLYRAKSYVHIMTPYLIIDNELERALKYAAERGVDVELILPGIPDKKSAYALAKTHYRPLLRSGVKIYEYGPGFVHAKVCVSDDIKAVVGTINLDYRSLYHHFECAAYLCGCSAVADIERDFCETAEKSAAVTLEGEKKKDRFYRLFGALIKILAPLL